MNVSGWSSASTTDSKKLSISFRLINSSYLILYTDYVFTVWLPIKNTVRKLKHTENSEIFEGYISDTVDLSVSLTQLKIQKFVLLCEFSKEILMMKPRTESEWDIAKCGLDLAECGWDVAECGWDTAECGLDLAECGWDTAECGLDLRAWMRSSQE